MPATTYAVSPIQLESLTDFTGGLNYRADAFQIHGSESPDMLNVDLDPRGGFLLRDGTAVMNSSALGNTPKNIWQFATTSGTQQVIVQNGVGTSNQLAYSTGSNFTNVTPDGLACSGVMRAATFNDLNYIQRFAQQVAVKWTGAAATVLGTSFNDDLTSPTSNNMPKAKCITAHTGYMFVANTNEADGTHPSRIRWSHPNKPADFRTLDYIDIDTGHDGDQITALMPFQDRLLIFKANSVHVLYGYDATSFSVQPLTMAVGAISQEAVVSTDFGIYFFSWPEGLMQFDGSEISWAFERLWPAISDGRIPAANQATIACGWINRRLWVTVPWQGSTNARVFVLDPSLARRTRYGSRLGREGGWTAYDLPLGPMMEWQPPGAGSTFLACHATTARVMKLHQATLTDDFGAGGVAIASHYTTRWVDASSPAVIKRWKRPEFILRNGLGAASITVQVLHDYNQAVISRTLQLGVTASGTSLIWDDGSHAANMKFDDNAWAAESSTSQEAIIRIGVLGRARSVQLIFTGPALVDWGIDAMNFKYIPRRLRA